ncbi:nucleotide-binding alpha-beta plait domain-containing protein [Tanacetum coccineum]
MIFNHVQTISTSVFVTNFPDQYGAKDLWNSCKAYGYVVDAYIPNRRSKEGKRFGFVRFIKVFDVERLISNLCTVAGRMELGLKVGYSHAHAVKGSKDVESKISFQSIVAVGFLEYFLLKSLPEGVVVEKEEELEEDGKECWVRAIEVPGWVPDFEDDSDEESNDGSHEDEVQGVTSGDRKYLVGDSDDDEVPETSFEDVSNKQSMDENVVSQSEPQSKDPFGLYEIINKKIKVCNNVSMSKGSLKHPPGFTPKDDDGAPVDVPDNASEENSTSNGKEDGGFVEKQTRVRNDMSTDANESTCSGYFKKSVAPRTGGSIIQLIDELVTVGQTMGYDMTGCIKNLEDIIESQGVNDVHR